MLLCLPLTGMISVGLAYTIIGLWQLANGTGDLLGLLTFAAVVIGLVLVWRIFGIRGRLTAYAPATGGFPAGAYPAADPTLVIDEVSPPPPGPRMPQSRHGAT